MIAADRPTLAAALNAGAFATTEEQFRSLLADLRRELDPGTVMEALLVEQIILAVTRLRNAALLEQAGTIDKNWLRYQTTAERSFWKALTTLEKGRRKAAPRRAAAAPEPPAVASPSPAPAQQAPTPAPTPARPQPRPEPAPTPRRPIRRDELESLLPGAELELPMIPVPARPAGGPAAKASVGCGGVFDATAPLRRGVA